jgi:hypothetical protein
MQVMVLLLLQAQLLLLLRHREELKPVAKSEPAKPSKCFSLGSCLH